MAVASAALLVTAGCGGDPLDELGEATGPLGDLQQSLSAVTLATRAQIAAGEVVPGSYIVAFRAPRGSGSRRFASFAGETRYHHSYLAGAFLADPRVRSLRYIDTVDLADPRAPADGPDFEAPPLLRLAWDEGRLDDLSAAIARVDFADDDASRSLLAEWEARGALWFAEPNHVNTMMENPYTTKLAEDYKAQNIHWHNSIKLGAALEALSKKEIDGAQAPVIAVLDSGVDVEHPALQGRIWVNPSPGASGCGNDLHGCDTTVAHKDVLGSGNINPYLTSGFAEDCPFPGAAPGSAEKSQRSVCGHGTHVAGIIASNLGGGIGGVCPVCQIMVIKIITTIGGRGVASDDAILGGFKYLTLFGTSQKIVRVANSSFGKYVRSRSVALLVSVLKKRPFELLVVGAAGNDDSMARGYPAALNDAIAVSAVNSQDAKAGYSNFGPWVDVAAPGGDTQTDGGIASTVPGGASDNTKQGTSMAAPVVAGIAGLILSVDPTRSFTSLRRSLIDTADCRLYAADNGSSNRSYYYASIPGENGRRPLLGSGVIDAAAAIENGAGNDCAGASVRRVTRNCSVIGGDGHERSPPSGLIWLLTLPLTLAFGASRRSGAHPRLTGGERPS